MKIKLFLERISGSESVMDKFNTRVELYGVMTQDELIEIQTLWQNRSEVVAQFNFSVSPAIVEIEEVKK